MAQHEYNGSAPIRAVEKSLHRRNRGLCVKLPKRDEDIPLESEHELLRFEDLEKEKLVKHAHLSSGPGFAIAAGE